MLALASVGTETLSAAWPPFSVIVAPSIGCSLHADAPWPSVGPDASNIPRLRLVSGAAGEGRGVRNDC